MGLNIALTHTIKSYRDSETKENVYKNTEQDAETREKRQEEDSDT